MNANFGGHPPAVIFLRVWGSNSKGSSDFNFFIWLTIFHKVITYPCETLLARSLYNIMTSPLLCSPFCSPDHEEEFTRTVVMMMMIISRFCHRHRLLNSLWFPASQLMVEIRTDTKLTSSRTLKNKVSNRDSHTMTIIRSNPNFVFEYLRTENGRPHDAREYCVKGVRIFAPHLQQGIPVQSPCCRSAYTAKQFVTGDPTKCYGMEDYHYILSYRY